MRPFHHRTPRKPSAPLAEPRYPGLEWPNSESRANSDRWLVENHDRIGVLRPRVLVLNFVNGLAAAAVRTRIDALRDALRESSRAHGHSDPLAPACLEYEVARVADLTDPVPPRELPDRNSSRLPRARDGVSFDHGALFDERFARDYGYEDPARPGVFLTLASLVERGLVHEVWFLMQHTAHSTSWETVEVKQTYDARFRPVGHTRDAGNSGEHGAPWIGRSLRVLFYNAERGVGCALESLGHSLEHMATCAAIPYFQRYFTEYAMLDLDRRHGLPFDSLYAVDGPIEYPTPTTLVCHHRGRRHVVHDYVVDGGNVHFVPNGRKHYDLANPAPVLSSAEAWRQRDAPGGGDRRVPWTPAVLDRYADLAPDCMGRWTVYWRQNMPGLSRRALDDRGRPMKSWWPFLFY